MEDLQILTSFFETDLGEASIDLGWSSCGRYLAVINADSEVTLFDAETNAELTRWTCHEDGALALAWHPRLSLFATSCQGGLVKFWRIEDDLSLSKISEISFNQDKGSTWIEFIEWRPNGKQLAVAVGNSVKLCTINSEIQAEFVFPGGTVGAIAWHSAGSLLGIAGYGGVSIYNASDVKSEPIVLKLKGSLLSLTWSPDNTFVVAGCQDNTVHLWRFRSRKDAEMSGFSYKPLQLTWANKGKKLITGGTNELVLWPFDKKGPEGRAPETRSFHSQAICALSVAANGQGIASGCRAGKVAIWKSSQETEPATSTSFEDRVEHLSWSSGKNSKILAATSRRGLLRIFDVSDAI